MHGRHGTNKLASTISIGSLLQAVELELELELKQACQLQHSSYGNHQRAASLPSGLTMCFLF
jgi:hypothetical protein